MKDTKLPSWINEFSATIRYQDLHTLDEPVIIQERPEIIGKGKFRVTLIGTVSGRKYQLVSFEGTIGAILQRMPCKFESVIMDNDKVYQRVIAVDK